MSFDAFREDERTGWDERADGYHDATARATLQSIPALLGAVRLYPEATLLDAGCGPGYVAGAASVLGADCKGLDFSPSMVAAAKRRYPGTAFVQGDVEALPFEDNSFDAVVSNIVLFHVTNPAVAVTEAFRVLKPGGYFAFSHWCAPEESLCYRLLFDVLASHADMSLANPAPNPFDLSDRVASRALMHDAGFSNIECTDVPNVLRVPGAGFYDFFMRFGVRIPLIMKMQSGAVQDIVRAEIDRSAKSYLIDGKICIPMPSFVVSGQKP